MLRYNKKSALLRAMIETLRQNLNNGMTPIEAVNNVSDRYGIYKGGNIYEYLLTRALEQ